MFRPYILAAILAVKFISPALSAEDGPQSAPVDPEDIEELTAGWERYQELMENKSWPAALDELARLVDIADFALPEDDSRVPILALNYAMMLERLNYDREADAAFVKARKKFEAIYETDSPEMVQLLFAEGDRLARPGTPTAQKSKYRDALNIQKQATGENSVEYAKALEEAGKRIMDLSKSDNGGRFLRHALKIYQEQLGHDDIVTADANITMARLYIGKGVFHMAEKYLLAALEGYDINTEVGRKRNIETRRYLVRAYEGNNRSESSVEHLAQLAYLLGDEQNSGPVLIARYPPDYPDGLREEGIEGSVTFRFDVGADGRVWSPQVTNVDGAEEFIDPALYALQQYRFAPAIADGEIQPYEGLEIDVVFSISPPRTTQLMERRGVPNNW